MNLLKRIWNWLTGKQAASPLPGSIEANVLELRKHYAEQRKIFEAEYYSPERAERQAESFESFCKFLRGDDGPEGFQALMDKWQDVYPDLSEPRPAEDLPCTDSKAFLNGCINPDYLESWDRPMWGNPESGYDVSWGNPTGSNYGESWGDWLDDEDM